MMSYLHSDIDLWWFGEFLLIYIIVVVYSLRSVGCMSFTDKFNNIKSQIWKFVYYNKYVTGDQLQERRVKERSYGELLKKALV